MKVITICYCVDRPKNKRMIYSDMWFIFNLRKRKMRIVLYTDIYSMNRKLNQQINKPYLG